MPGQKHIPHGMSVSFNSADIGGLKSIGLPERERGVADVTDADSAGNREHLPGLKDGGTVQLTCYRIPEDAGQAAMLANYDLALTAAVAQATVITLAPQAHDDAGTTTLSFDSFVTSPGTGEFAQDSDDGAEVTYTLKVSGAITEAHT